MTTKKQKGEPKGSPKYDYTSKKRGQKRTALDNAWAQKVSGGKYKTLRNLMRAIHTGEYALVETQPTMGAADVRHAPEDREGNEGILPGCRTKTEAETI